MSDQVLVSVQEKPKWPKPTVGRPDMEELEEMVSDCWCEATDVAPRTDMAN